MILVPWAIGGSLWVTVGVDRATGGLWQRAFDGVMIAHLAGSVAVLAPWMIALFMTAPWPIAYTGVPRKEFRRRLVVAGAGLFVLAASITTTYLADLWPGWLPDTDAWGI